MLEIWIKNKVLDTFDKFVENALTSQVECPLSESAEFPAISIFNVEMMFLLAVLSINKGHLKISYQQFTIKFRIILNICGNYGIDWLIDYWMLRESKSRMSLYWIPSITTEKFWISKIFMLQNKEGMGLRWEEGVLKGFWGENILHNE